LNYTLHHGDAFELMKTMEAGSVDHVITDPPYSEATHDGARSHTDIKNSFIHFAPFSDEEFVTLCREAVRVARRWVIMTCEWRHAVLAEQSDLPVIRLGVWIKGHAAPQFTGDRPGTGWEAVLMLHRKGIKRWNGGGHHAVWKHDIVRGDHPTQKPLPLLKQWIGQFTVPGEVILDPLMGSASTGVAALQSQRGFIGIERDANFYALAEKRIREAAMQPHLLAI
jgi:site-specific DNA-methyltransferase (adenine-specific)